ncbi:M48 family metalloprotease [Tritonibacter mobilis]|uniref:M48 family metalloprotease n=2 Tax=Tritonibacter mobilis TaxID=379347 RepID=UPI000806B3F8|nr:M48 family metalloprotease [Tritonibacter mobilis]GLP84569.1 hypothetical protein GCM10007921_01290 [Tritonibacter mobilis]
MMLNRFSRFPLPALMVAGLLTAVSCGTTYELPDTGGAYSDEAARLFAEARQSPPPKTLSRSAAEVRFARVEPRVMRAGRETCLRLKTGVNCNVDIAIDREMDERNAYFTYQNGQPIIRISLPLIQDTGSDDEVAFVLAHEYGHLIGRHVEKQQQQVLAGALIGGALAGIVGDSSDAVGIGMGVGASAGGIVYSQSYELESDTLGTRIAYDAGYDPVEGAKFFARSEAARGSGGGYSIWGTHPPDRRRVATVLATKAQIDGQVGLRNAN